MNRTKIEYLDYTWNPIVGCSGVDCAVRKDCWARGQARRQKPRVGKDGKKRGCQDCYDFKPHYHLERFCEPSAVKKPARIGVGFMGDIFDDNFLLVPTVGLFTLMAAWSQHIFVCLTKQSRNMLNFSIRTPNISENIWMGISVNRKEDLYRIAHLKDTDVAVKFVSFEPLLEDLGNVDLNGIDWVIIGAQRRPDVQPSVQWVADLVLNAKKFGAKVFLKNNLSCRDCLGNLQEIPGGT